MHPAPRFSEMPYERPDVDALKKSAADLIAAWDSAEDIDEQVEVIAQWDAHQALFQSNQTLAMVHFQQATTSADAKAEARDDDGDDDGDDDNDGDDGDDKPSKLGKSKRKGTGRIKAPVKKGKKADSEKKAKFKKLAPKRRKRFT